MDPAAGGSDGRVADAGRMLRCGLANALRGARITAGIAAGEIGRSAAALARGRVATAARNGGRGLARLVLQLPADAFLMSAGSALSALQTILGIEEPGRRLAAGEQEVAAAVLGVDFPVAGVRIKHGSIGLLGLPRRPFALGDTVFVPAGWRAGAPTASGWSALLAHELVHVAQHRRWGTRYLSEALLAQWFGEAYDVGAGLARGGGWSGLDREQQAELVERAWSAGWFRSGPPRRCLVRRLDPARNPPFELLTLMEEDLAAREAFAGLGFGDATAALREGLAELRAANGGAAAEARRGDTADGPGGGSAPPPLV